MKYKMSYSNNIRITAKDRNAIESMLGRIGESSSMGYQPSGRTKYSISRDDNGFSVTIQRSNGVEQEKVFIKEVYLD